VGVTCAQIGSVARHETSEIRNEDSERAM
jgi:hypothetical protein